MLKVQEFIKKHKNWKELLQKEPYNITIKEDEYYYLLKYEMIKSDMSLEIVRDCRGLIIDKKTLEPVALSFRKFSNIQEPIHDDIDWNSAVIQEKVDGSKMLLFWNKYKNEWQLSTSGTLNAYEAQVNDFGVTFGNLFDKALLNSISVGITDCEKLHIFDELLHKKYCYTFELVSPESRIVVPYNKTEIYFIGIRDMTTLQECDTEDNILSSIIKIPKRYPLKTLEDCLKATEAMGYDEEGFVVVDKDWHRVKIKSPAYVAVHSIRQNGTINLSSVLELIDNNKQDDYLSIFPEYKEYFDKVETSKERFIKGLKTAYNKLKEMYSNNKELTRKDYAIWIKNNYNDYSSFLFNCLINLENNNEDEIIKEYYSNLTNEKKLKYLKLK